MGGGAGFCRSTLIPMRRIPSVKIKFTKRGGGKGGIEGGVIDSSFLFVKIKSSEYLKGNPKWNPPHCLQIEAWSPIRTRAQF